MSSRHAATGRPPDVKPEPLSRQCLLVLAVVVLFCVSVKIVHRFVVQEFLDWYYLVLDCVFDKEYINKEEREHCEDCLCNTTLNEKLCSQHRLCQNIWPLESWMSAPFNTGGVLYLLRYLPAIVILLAVGGCCYMYMEDRKKASGLLKNFLNPPPAFEVSLRMLKVWKPRLKPIPVKPLPSCRIWARVLARSSG